MNQLKLSGFNTRGQPDVFNLHLLSPYLDLQLDLLPADDADPVPRGVGGAHVDI